MKIRHRSRTSGLTVARATGALMLAGLLGCSLLAPAARADQFDVDSSPIATGSGYQVSVTFTGNAAPGGGSTRTAGVRAACWWRPAQGPNGNAQEMLDRFTDTTEVGVAVPGYADQVFDERQIWQDAADREKDGTDLTWYRAICRDPADYATFNAGTRAPNSVFAMTLVMAIPVGQAPPPPLIDPADLAQTARDAMVIPAPATERNPKINAAGGPTLVGLPTWFWVTDAASVGGAAGTRTIRAQVGNVWAEVTATTGGLQLSSPSGGTTCSPARATTKYADGVPEASACTVEFARASVAYPSGYPVTATTNWQATWAGSDGTTGAVDALARTLTVNVPVAEVQNVVTGSG